MKQYDTVWGEKTPSQHYKSTFPQKVLTLFKDKKVKKILDLGSGDGTNLLFLQKLGFEPYGIEISKIGMEKTKKAARDIVVIQGDIFSPLPFPEQSFDAVYSFQALNHAHLPDIQFLFQEVKRILKSGGIFSVKAADRGAYKLKKIKDNVYLDQEYNLRFQFLDEQTYIPLEGDEKGLVHYAFYKKQLEEEVCKRGFRLLFSEKAKWYILATFEKIK